MEISYANKKVQELCEKHEIRKKKLGNQVADRLSLAMKILDKAKNLEEVASYNHLHLHKLVGNFDGFFAIDIGRKLGYRLIFRPMKGSHEYWIEFENLSTVYRMTELIKVSEVSNHYE